MAVKIHVTYCGGWGYRPKFEALKAQILDEFDASKVDIVGESTPNTSGAMEVKVNDQLVHSKLTKGDGFIDSDAKLNKIFDAIQAGL